MTAKNIFKELTKKFWSKLYKCKLEFQRLVGVDKKPQV